MLFHALFVFLQVLLQFSFSAAYSWKFNSVPTQCSNISISVTGSDGLPPYNVLVVPFGPTPFQDKIDVRGPVYKAFDGNSDSISFAINYPADTQFVAVVSDASGFGSGGTSNPTSVAQSDDSNCFNVSQAWSPDYWFYFGPPQIIGANVVQCTPVRIWWNDTAVVEGTPTFVAVIPGGQSLAIEPGSGITNSTTDEGIGFTWVPNIREGTQVVFVSGDNRGLGSGGSSQTIIDHSDNSTCVPPAGTTGTPPGAINSGSRRNIRAIIGGAVGGVVVLLALLAIVFFFRRQNAKEKEASKYNGDLSLGYDMVSNGTPSSPSNLLTPYNVEPFGYQGPATDFSGGGYGNADAGNLESQRVLTPMRGGFGSGGWNSHQSGGLGRLTSSGSGTIYSGYDSTITPSADHQTFHVVRHKDSGEVPPEGALIPTTINLPPDYDSLGTAL